MRKEGRRWVEREGDGWRGKVMGGEGRRWVEREGDGWRGKVMGGEGGDGWRGKVMGGEGRGWVEREGKRKGLRRVAIGLGFQEDKATSWL